MIELKVYLKSRIRPLFCFELDNEKQIEEFNNILNSRKKIISYGPVMFNKDDFLYAEITKR